MRLEYIAKKTIYAAITIFLILIFNYFLFRIVPGDPLAMLMRNPKATPEMIAGIKALYGLDQAWHVQFFNYLGSLFKGDMGMSFMYKAPVADVIAPKVLPTLALFGVAEILSIIIGIFMGIVAAWKRGSKLDVGILGFSLTTYSMPTFWLGMIMISLFCVSIQIFPVGGMLSPTMAFAGQWEQFWDMAWHLILPALTLSILMIGEYMLTMRNSLIDVLSEDYIVTARAKGFNERYILKNHAVPNAMLPMVTLVAMNLGLVVGGAIQIETVFSWPGLGYLMYEAINGRDYPLLQGLFLLFTVSIVIANYIADIAYFYIDPRVRE